MKKSYVLKHVYDEYKFTDIICIVPRKDLAEKLMHLYAKYVVWNYITEIDDSFSWDSRIEFKNYSYLMIEPVTNVSNIKDFKRMICFNFDEDEQKV